MKELPKPIVALFLILGFLLIAMVVIGINKTHNSGPNDNYLDQININTDNPQPAGKNLKP